MINKNVFVTGGNGFIGKNVVARLKELGNTVVSIDLVYEIDIDALKGMDVAIHLASNTDTRDVSELSQSFNVTDFAQLADSARVWKVPIVFASSAAVYGLQKDWIDPLNAYARSKALIEIYAQFLFKDVPSIGLRYFNVYGPGERHKVGYNSMVYQIIDKAMRDETVKLFKNGEQKRDFVHVTDVVEGTVLAADFLIKGGAPRLLPLDIGSGNSVSFNEIVSVVEKVLGKTVKVEYIDNPYSFFQSDTKANIEGAKGLLNYKPKFNIEKGIAAYVKDWEVFYTKENPT